MSPYSSCKIKATVPYEANNSAVWPGISKDAPAMGARMRVPSPLLIPPDISVNIAIEMTSISTFVCTWAINLNILLELIKKQSKEKAK